MGNPMSLELQVSMHKAKALNNYTFIDYYTRLQILALSIFQWTGLPEEISARYLEHALFDQGRAVFFKDPAMGYLALRGGPEGPLNVYGDPLRVMVVGHNGYNKVKKPGEYVFIRNNYEARPTEPTLRLYAQRLAIAERSIDVNINAQRTPMLILCDEKQRLTMKNLYAQYEGNEPVIFGDKSMNPDAIKSIKTEATFVADKLFQYKRDLWNECMTFLGINNANTDKKERLITDEVQANDQLIQMSAQTMLLCRQEACEQINKLYGLSISVGMRELESQPEIDQEEIEDPAAKEEGATDE